MRFQAEVSSLETLQDICYRHYNVNQTSHYELIFNNQVRLEKMVREKVDPIIDAIAFVTASVIVVCLVIYVSSRFAQMKKARVLEILGEF